MQRAQVTKETRMNLPGHQNYPESLQSVWATCKIESVGGKVFYFTFLSAGWGMWHDVCQSRKSNKQNEHTWMIHLWDGDSGQFLHYLREAGHDVQHLSWQLGRTHLPISTGHHGHLVGSTQRLTDLFCHLADNKCYSMLKTPINEYSKATRFLRCQWQFQGQMEKVIVVLCPLIEKLP